MTHRSSLRGRRGVGALLTAIAAFVPATTALAATAASGPGASSGDPLESVVMSGHGTDADAGDYLQAGSGE